MTPNDGKGPVELRSVPIVAADLEQRIIELIAVPYDEWTQVEYQGRMIEESFAPGAFGKVADRIARDRPQVYMEHDREEWLGRVLAVFPDDPAGLRAELKLRSNQRQTLEDAADGMLAASVGFAVKPDRQEWEGRSRRRIREAFLDHIALCRQPAYAGAVVLNVRSSSSGSATPNLDQVLALRAEQDYRLRGLNR